MGRRREVAGVYTAALLQGIALVTFPAASRILTSPQHHGLSSAEYGLLFVPQTLMAVVAALIAVEKILPWRRVATYGTAAILFALGLFVLIAPSVVPGLTIPDTSTMPMGHMGM